jgi:hypothetical protein
MMRRVRRDRGQASRDIAKIKTKIAQGLEAAAG